MYEILKKINFSRCVMSDDKKEGLQSLLFEYGMSSADMYLNTWPQGVLLGEAVEPQSCMTWTMERGLWREV